MQNPRVSIIVPVYNAEKYISRCVDSLLSQTEIQIEVILVNDGSTDSSLEICLEYQGRDTRVKVLDFSNRGVSSARNEGLMRASGEYILFVDSDDFIDTNTVEILLSLQEKYKECAVLYSVSFEYNDVVKLGNLSNPPFKLSDMLEGKVRFENTDLILCSPCNKLYKKNVLKENNILFDSSLPFGEDFNFNSKYFSLKSELVMTDIVYYHYDCTIAGSAVKKVYKNFNTIINTLDESFRSFLHKIDCNAMSAKQFYLNFIKQRWDFAIYTLLNSNERIASKVNLLLTWSRSMPVEIVDYIKHCRDYSDIYNYLIFENTPSRIIRLRNYIICHTINRNYFAFKARIKRLLK